jgi:hypothetical protein
MTLKEAALMLDGREYLNELTDAEEALLKESGIVAVFGYSDDCVELRGAIYDEVGAWNGTTLYFDKDCLLENPCCNEDCPCFKKKLAAAKTIDACWDEEGECVWSYETDMPHEEFDILHSGEKYCRGIVFEMSSLTAG